MAIKHPFNPSQLSPLALAVAVALPTSALMSTSTLAQESVPQRSASRLLEEVVVTARKREEGAQEVPLSVTAFNSDQISALKVRDLNDLTVGIPNVSLEDIGTSRGTANFSIRGLGVNSSIPSIDPTVGVFNNGVYIGTNAGVIFDTFDVESLEVLRGPQGTLFGRNVTGGAVLLNTKKPGDELEATIRTSVETGDIGGESYIVQGAVGGPITDNFGARVVVHYNDDDGQLENDFNGDDVLAVEQTMVRTTLTWTPGDRTDLSFIYEYTDIDGDGPQAQSHTNGSGIDGSPINHDRDDFDLNIDEVGYQESETDFFIAQLDQGIDFGDGTITAIFGYRDLDQEGVGDIDAQPTWVFHAPSWLESEQTSFELRYNGLFAEAANVTTGVFFYENDLTYHERRDLAGILTGNTGPAVRQDGGGEHDTESFTWFAQVDYDLTDQWTLTAGVNYSTEEKDVKITSLGVNTSLIPALGGTGITECNIVNGPACVFDFTDDEDWDNWAPKLGATYHIDDDQRIYGHWTVGYRSGGYNLRNTDPFEAPGPFDEEEVNNFEIGYKSTHEWGRLNAALFYQEIDDMQREVNLPSETSGVVQLIRNTADATISGVEVDATISLTDSLLMIANVGYIDAEYDSVRFDLNGDGVVDGQDEDLDLPRAPELTWSLGLTHDLDIGSWGYMTSRVQWSYRDDFAYTDSNLGYVEEVDIVDAGLDFYSNDGRWVFSLYGKNLLDEVSFGNDTQLPSLLLGAIPLGGTFAPVMPGIRYGAEVTYNFF
jgi:iron complex outermembrane receptor protein